MDTGARALLSGCIAFLVATSAVRLLVGDRTRIDAMTIGGLTGGAVALSVWIDARRDAQRSEATDH